MKAAWSPFFILMVLQFVTPNTFIAVAGNITPTGPTNWIAKKMFEQKNFIENKGQVVSDKLPNKEVVLYFAQIDGVTYYFTKNGYTIAHAEKQEMSEIERETQEAKLPGGRKEKEEKEFQFKLVETFHELKWEGSNPNPEIIVENKVKNYYSYSDPKNIKATIIAYAYTRITYKELYPHVDVVFEFPKDSTGIKYSIYLHPGADAGKIRMRFPGEQFSIKNSDLVIHSAFGKVIDHEPISYTAETKSVIKSKFKIIKNEIGFKLENDQKDKTIIIDPWTATPDFSFSNSSAYDVDYDNLGNVYIYGGGGSLELSKYDPAGTLLWTYASAFSISGVYGDFAVDRSSNNIYLVEGFHYSPGARVIKINSAASVVAVFGGDPDFYEMWRITFSRCTNQAVIGGGGLSVPSYQICYLDTNLTGLTPVSYDGSGVSGVDVALLALDNHGNCYELAVQGSSDNHIIKLPLPGLSPIIYDIPTNYSFREMGSVQYYRAGATFIANGYNGLTTSNNYVYSCDGYVLKKWDAPTGNLLMYKRIHYPNDYTDPFGTVVSNDSSKIYWGGISADDCGNLFVADSNVVLQYDSTLTLINSYLMPGVITDVNYSNTRDLYVCGLGFVSSLTPTDVVSCINSLAVATSVVGATCTSPGSASVIITGGTAPFTITWNTFPVQHGDTATNLPPGTYTLKVTDASCIRNVLIDTIVVPASGGAFLSIPDINSGCSGLNNGSITITNSGGVSPYTYLWSSTSADTSALYNLIPGSYDVTITDSAGCANVFSSLIINTPDTIHYSFRSGTKCFNDTTTLNIVITGGASPYLVNWSIPPATGTSIHGIYAGEYVVGIITDDNGCNQSFTYTFPTSPLPAISISNDTVIFIGSTAPLVVSGGINYTWRPPTGLSCITCANPIATPVKTTNYCVVVDNGICMDSACVKVTVEVPCPGITELHVPNAFSPNNDGNNDNFFLQGWGNCMKEFNIIIYDRWGEKIFESANVNFNWDGTYKNKVLDPAVYIYVIKARSSNDEAIDKKGNITLIR